MFEFEDHHIGASKTHLLVINHLQDIKGSNIKDQTSIVKVIKLKSKTLSKV